MSIVWSIAASRKLIDKLIPIFLYVIADERKFWRLYGFLNSITSETAI